MIELMVIIAIIGILAGMSALSMDYIRKERVLSKTKEVLADLQGARMDGMVTGPTATTGSIPFMRGGGIRFVNSNSYIIFKFNDCNQDYDYDVDGCSSSREEADSHTITMPTGIELKRVTGGALESPNNDLTKDILIFDRFGQPRQASWAVGNRTLVVMHQTAGHKKCISISTSRIRQGNWNGTDCVEQ